MKFYEILFEKMCLPISKIFLNIIIKISIKKTKDGVMYIYKLEVPRQLYLSKQKQQPQINVPEKQG